MAWTETCKVDLRAQVEKRKEICGGVRPAIRELSKESSIPYGTLRDWYYKGDSVPKIRNTSKSDPSKQTGKIADLHTLTFDSGRRKILFELVETDGNRFLVMKECRLGRKGKETFTKNRLTVSMDLLPHFRAALEQVEVLIRERSSAESDADGSNPQENDEVGPPHGDDGGLVQENEVDLNGEGMDLSPEPANGAEDRIVETDLVRCADCAHFAAFKSAPEQNGACNSRSGPWNGKNNYFQPPHELHPCESFSLRQQQG